MKIRKQHFLSSKLSLHIWSHTTVCHNCTHNIFMIDHYSVICKSCNLWDYWSYMCKFIQNYVSQCQNVTETNSSFMSFIMLLHLCQYWKILISHQNQSHHWFSVTQPTHLNCILIIINIYIKMTHFMSTIMIVKILDIINLF
jgi:hypothetical protein